MALMLKSKPIPARLVITSILLRKADKAKTYLPVIYAGIAFLLFAGLTYFIFKTLKTT